MSFQLHTPKIMISNIQSPNMVNYLLQKKKKKKKFKKLDAILELVHVYVLCR